MRVSTGCVIASGWVNIQIAAAISSSGATARMSVQRRRPVNPSHGLTAARFRLHDLRDTHASLLAKAGVPIEVVSKRSAIRRSRSPWTVTWSFTGIETRRQHQRSKRSSAESVRRMLDETLKKP